MEPQCHEHMQGADEVPSEIGVEYARLHERVDPVLGPGFKNALLDGKRAGSVNDGEGPRLFDIDGIGARAHRNHKTAKGADIGGGEKVDQVREVGEMRFFLRASFP